jgi:hypothetical protein
MLASVYSDNESTATSLRHSESLRVELGAVYIKSFDIAIIPKAELPKKAMEVWLISAVC